MNTSLKRHAQAGSFESGDALVSVVPSSEQIAIRIKSKVGPRFSQAMHSTVHEVLASFGVTTGAVDVVDSGALDFVLRARVTTAVKRALEA